MKFAGYILAGIMVLLSSGTRAGVLVTPGDVTNGAANIMNPVFREAADTGTGIGAAVNFLVTGDTASGTIARTSLIRSITTARDSLPTARGFLDDASSRILYDAMITYDLLSGTGAVNAAEASRFQEYMKQIIDRYLDPAFYNWYTPGGSLGTNAMRIAACCALFALDFPGDLDSGRYLSHARRTLEQNLSDSIDDGGAWLTDSPDTATAALEYIIIVSRAFRNAGIYDYFGNPRLAGLMRYFIVLLPPGQPGTIAGTSPAVEPGLTCPGMTHGAVSAMAAPDIRQYSPDTAYNTMWYWKRCGQPVTPLGTLFIHTDIEALPPTGGSQSPGGGIAVFRDRFGEPRESMVLADFGPAYGIPDHDHTHQIAPGDFSFIWRGIPLIVPGHSTDQATRELVGRREWRHNLVLNAGAGDLPVLPVGMYAGPDIAPHTSTPAPNDMYPGGLSSFFTTGLVDYAAGPVRLSDASLAANSRYRHLLFLKPDALFVWDQVDSAFPLEWNLWMPAENAWSEENVLRVHTAGDINLEVYFAGDSTIDFSHEDAPEAMMWDWPLVMRASHGAGTITFTTLDLFGDAPADTVTFARDLFQNMLMDGGDPAPVGVITGTSRTDSLLAALGIRHERITPDAVTATELRRYRTLVIGDFGATSLDRVIHDSGAVISEYIREGGRALLVCRDPEKWRFPHLEGPAFPPEPLTITGERIALDPDTFRPNMYPDSLWSGPNAISNQDWLAWVSDGIPPEDSTVVSLTMPVQSPRRTFLVPGTWSDAWQVLASAYISIPVDAAASPAGPQSRIRVRHPRARDFKALILPRRIGEPYIFDVRRVDDNMITFAEPNRTWTITTGGTEWTDAALSVRVENADSTELYAFECTFIRIGDEDIRFGSPLSIQYSGGTRSGIIATPLTNTLYYSKGEIRVHAGEIEFSDLFGNISLERRTYLTTLRVSDQNGTLLPWAGVYQDGRFVGTTDEHGMIPLRWSQSPPEIRVNCQGAQAIRRLAPGDMQVLLSLP